MKTFLVSIIFALTLFGANSKDTVLQETVMELHKAETINRECYRGQRVAFPNTSLGHFERVMSNLAEQLQKNISIMYEDKIIAVTSFTFIDSSEDDKRANALGNIIAEYLINHLQVRCFNIVDTRNIKVAINSANSTFVFDDNFKKRMNEYNSKLVVIGSVAQYGGGMVINARIVDLSTSLIASTAKIILSEEQVRRILLEPMKLNRDNFIHN